MAKPSSNRDSHLDGSGAATRVADLVPGMQASGIFVVKKKVCREHPGGSKFLLFQFSDSSGAINGVMWEGVEAVQREVATGDLVHLQGEVQLYQSSRQIKVRRIERADPAGFDLSDFLPTSRHDLDTLYARALQAMDGVRDPHLRRLLGDVLGDRQVAEAYKHAPAGKGWHHAWVGGLLEHVVAMLELGEVLARQHPELDRDLLVGGILLHDIGKIEEMTCRSHIEYTDAGKLIGHLVQGCVLVSRCMDRIDGFPDELRTRLLHIIVSHHGSLERGAPKPPMTLEAMAVHLLDQLDSQAQGVAQVVSRNSGEDGWSEHVKLLDRFFFRGRGARDPSAGGSPSA